MFIAKFHSKVIIYALTKNWKRDVFPFLAYFLILNGITFWRVYLVSVQCRESISIWLDRFHSICIIRLWKQYCLLYSVYKVISMPFIFLTIKSLIYFVSWSWICTIYSDSCSFLYQYKSIIFQLSWQNNFLGNTKFYLYIHL